MKLGKMERRLLELYRDATDDQDARGMAWYPEARVTVKRLATLAGIGVPQAAAVIAVISPRIHWKYNIEAAQDIATTGRTTGVFGANVTKAIRVLAEEQPELVLSGPKVLAFYANLCGDDETVTIDGHMVRACGHHRIGITPKQYERMAKAVTNAAAVVKLPPAYFQAVVWIVVREKPE